MKEKDAEKPRKRVVVEEVAPAPATPKIDPVAASTEVPDKPIETPKPEVEESVHHEEESSRIPEKFAPKQPPKSSGSILKYFLIIIPILAILGAVAGGIYVFTKNVSNEATPTPEPTMETPIPTPTPTEIPKADLSKFTIAIQNGSGIAGEATKAQKILTDAGFKVSSIGNAKTYDYEKTTIQAKSAVDETYLRQLSTTLGKTYEMGDKATLADKEKTDVVVIIGKTKAQ